MKQGKENTGMCKNMDYSHRQSHAITTQKRICAMILSKHKNQN
jgi:hypothetical protein